MVFNSFEFLIYLPIVVFLYYTIPFNKRVIILLGASYFFYMYWNPKYIFLILASTLIDYFCAIKMSAISEKLKRRKYLALSVITNLGLLFTFKYFNFFLDITNRMLSVGNIAPLNGNLDLLLPVGISFYTFQTLSYSIDVYHGKAKVERNIGYFALYVSYFPQLVAGPIERPNRLLPQLREKHGFNLNNLIMGSKIFIWGLFKKVVIADRLALLVDVVYSNPEQFNSLQLLMAAIFFVFQMYCDFAGYSDMAVGIALMMGVDLVENFKTPFLSKSITEFWSRWHISLSTWLRDYITIPSYRYLKRYKNLPNNYIAIFITFLFSGLWHGANYTFLIWGILNGFAVMLEKATEKTRKRIKKRTKIENRLVNYLYYRITIFAFICFTAIFFRSETLTESLFIIKKISQDFFDIFKVDFVESILHQLHFGKFNFIIAIMTIVLLEVVDLLTYKKSIRNLFEMISELNIYIRWSIYYFLIFSIILLGEYGSKEYIYFQF